MRSFVKVFHCQYTRFGCFKEIIGKLNKGQSKNQPTYRDVKKGQKWWSSSLWDIWESSHEKFLKRPKYEYKPV